MAPWPERLAHVHAAFERVHPFLDGNGRTGRLVLNLVLVRLGYPPLVVLKQQRPAYLAALACPDAGDDGPLGEIVVRAITENLNRFVLPAVAGPARSGRARGRVALVLHSEDGPDSATPTVDHLGVEHQVIVPTHPGWAGTQRAAGMDSVGALARVYLDLLAAAGASDVVVVGISFGGWVGAQTALGDGEGRIGALVLIGPIGARVSGQAVRLPAATQPCWPAWVRSPCQPWWSAGSATR